jgi:hypothetical protein
MMASDSRFEVAFLVRHIILLIISSFSFIAFSFIALSVTDLFAADLFAAEFSVGDPTAGVILKEEGASRVSDQKSSSSGKFARPEYVAKARGILRLMKNNRIEGDSYWQNVDPSGPSPVEEYFRVMKDRGPAESAAWDAIFAATHTDDTCFVELFVEAARNGNFGGDYLNTMLNLAVLDGFVDLVKIYVAAGASVDGKDSHGVSALARAAISGRLDIARFLVTEGASVDSGDDFNTTPLAIACCFGRTDIVEYLVSKGADVNLADKFGSAPLALASMKGRLDIVKLLVTNGANPDVKDKAGKTALDLAKDEGHKEVADYLKAIAGEK